MSQPPPIYPQHRQVESGSISDENQERESSTCTHTIHREHDVEDGIELLSQTDYDTSLNHESIESETRLTRSFWQSLQRSLRTNVGIMIAVIMSQPPPISRQNSQVVSGSMSYDNQERVYDGEDGWELQPQSDYDTLVKYVPLESESRIKPSIWQSLRRSLRANVGIMMAVIPLGVLLIALVYFDMKSSQLCFEWEQHNNSISNNVMRWKLIGEDIGTILLNIWFPVTLMLLFGWKEYKSNYISTLYIGFTAGAADVIYKTFLFVFGVFRTKMYYRYPGNVIFIAAIIFSRILVARKFRSVHRSTVYSYFHITFIISFNFLAGFVITMIYRYFIVPRFNEQEDEIKKAIMAAVTPAVALIPTAICKYIVLRQSSEMIQPDRSFLLVYFLRGATIVLYRIMQADFKSLLLFIGLSLLHGFSNVFSIATQSLRVKKWTSLIVCLRRTSRGRRLELHSLNTPHHRQLNADMEIQNMLFEYNSLILSQVYVVLYLITSFDVSPWHVIEGSLIRMAIGFGIDFVFNSISVFIQIHYHDVPMRSVWLKYRKRHVIANAIILALVVFYFTPVLLTVFQDRGNKSANEYTLRNCTSPFGN